MPVDRPTFSESWYRVADLRPRLAPGARLFRQQFRGQLWHVIQDQGSNQFLRLNESAYAFVGLLDGQRSVAQAWDVCNERMGDSAPTQGEAISLLGQLYGANLLWADLPGDAEGLFNRYKKRKTREVQGTLMNLLFIRLPLLDPDSFLNRWVVVFGKIFTWYFLAFWVALMAVAASFMAGRVDELADRAAGVLSQDNLPLLYAGMVLAKICHEFGHAFSCKRFGRLTGSGGEVHAMGVMLLVFLPLPYVDASSTWAFRSKWHRAAVGAAGMFVELALAAVAAIIWANTASGTPINALCYNLFFIAGVSTVLFNANPLLRYDGYYILSDLLEIPNLAQRSKEYLTYLVRKYAWGVRQARSSANSAGERIWFVIYGISSITYRVIISMAILLFVADKLFFLGAILAIGALIGWILVPLGKLLHYLFVGAELQRVRGRAISTVLLLVAAVGGLVGAMPASDYVLVDGVVSVGNTGAVRAGADGFIVKVMPTDQPVQGGTDELVKARNVELETQLEMLQADRAYYQARRNQAMSLELAAVDVADEQIRALDKRIEMVRSRLCALSTTAPTTGTWVSDRADELEGLYVQRGQVLGQVVVGDQLTLRVVAGQNVAAALISEASNRVEIRLKGRPDRTWGGTVDRILLGGQEYLPSAALGFSAGGSVATDSEDPKGRRAAEQFFDVRVKPDDPEGLGLQQRVVVRFRLSDRPLAQQWWRSIRQMVQRRFRI